jgi:hypothetical protein
MFHSKNLETLNETLDAFLIPVFCFDFHDDSPPTLSGLNQAHTQMTGMERDTNLGKMPGMMLSQPEADWVTQRYTECAVRKSSINYSEILDLPKGRFAWRTTLYPVLDENNEVFRVLGQAVGIQLDEPNEAGDRFVDEMTFLSAQTASPLHRAVDLLQRSLDTPDKRPPEDLRMLRVARDLCEEAIAASRSLRSVIDQLSRQPLPMHRLLNDGELSRVISDLEQDD